MPHWIVDCGTKFVEGVVVLPVYAIVHRITLCKFPEPVQFVFTNEAEENVQAVPETLAQRYVTPGGVCDKTALNGTTLGVLGEFWVIDAEINDNIWLWFEPW